VSATLPPSSEGIQQGHNGPLDIGLIEESGRDATNLHGTPVFFMDEMKA
jgi:hypothetical protein